MDVRRQREVQDGRCLRTLPPIHGRSPWTLQLLERRQQDQEMEEMLGTETALLPDSDVISKGPAPSAANKGHCIQDFHSNMEVVTLRWEELRVQEAGLKDQLLTSQRLILENGVKCWQADAKTRRAQEIWNHKEHQLHRLQEEKHSLVERKQKIQAQIQQYNKFCDFLESTVETSEEFRASGDVLARFYMLVDTSRYLQRTVQEAQASSDQARAQLCSFMKEKGDEALKLDNQLGQLQSHLDHAQNQRLLWESQWMHIQNTATNKTLLIGTIKTAAQNLFRHIAVLERSVVTEDTMTQLEMVQQHIQDLTDVYEATRRQLVTNAEKRA
ncbi:coiled-coil domain-containing protein 42-like isoform X2 [Ranitomeya variabilis]|uniref:coiled-coil domain-containing protein 42-like isoform X2 n=1 Tax=Ranitomeya variabilis TaxID=490064 RepID=UPI0040575AA7